jgi:hypothetical protein
VYVSTYIPVVDGVKPALVLICRVVERMDDNDRANGFGRGSVRLAVPEMSATSTSTRVGTRGVVNERRGTERVDRFASR